MVFDSPSIRHLNPFILDLFLSPVVEILVSDSFSQSTTVVNEELIIHYR